MDDEREGFYEHGKGVGALSALLWHLVYCQLQDW